MAKRDTVEAALREAFDRGLGKGRDPTRKEPAAGGGTRTTIRSPWLGKTCTHCGHTFRRGDAVDPAGAARDEVRHGEVCPDEETISASASSREREAFYAGVASAHPPPEGLPLVRLLPGDPRLAAPGGAGRRPSCVICGHTLRPFDEVVVCPCSPEAPLCRGAVHRDAIRTMYCFDEWQKSKIGQHCPVTSRKLT
ncbi:hypothetical protein [Polyangium fumosum]|uniref:Uncharacterized protein n=1 Tax=Polyangium fumosum TaxID=889272 RepID=A0A4U1J799_9BACT|nr:hypothetical protein [Polyangium fumosum]TKD03189.1 hypothetical protein E8A74_27140 [Polyangium fumosum]